MAAAGLLRPSEKDWQGAFDNLCQRFSDLAPNTIVDVLRKENGHAGRSAKALRSLSAADAPAPAAATPAPAPQKADPPRKPAAAQAKPEPAEPVPQIAAEPELKPPLPEAKTDYSQEVSSVADTEAPPSLRVDQSKLIFVAALQGDIQTLEHLVVVGADLNGRYTGRPNKEQADKIIDATPLHLVVAMGKADIVEVLLKHGADFELKMRRALGSGKPPEEQYAEMTPLHLAAMEGHTNIVEMLLLRGADKGALMQVREAKADASVERTMTPLEIAKEMAVKGHSRESVISLLSK